MTPFWMTVFDDRFAQSLRGEDMTLDRLADLIRNTSAPTKEALPMLKLGRFGSVRTPAPANSLRSDANYLSASGCEGDHDLGTMPITEAADRLEQASIACLLYTTPSHTPQSPHWRVVLPFSKDLPPAERARMVSRVNGILGGMLARESWVLSQGFFFGSIDGAAPVEIIVGDGEEPIDERDDLDATAQPYRPAPGATGKPDLDKLDETELLELIETGQVYYGAARRLLAMWAQQGVTEADARSNLENAFDALPVLERDKKWSKRRGNIARWVKDAYARHAKKKRVYLRGLVACLEETPHWRGAIRLNGFTQTIEVCDPFPPQPGQTPSNHRQVHDPADILRALMDVQENGFPKAGKETIRDAIILVADSHTYHPVRDYLDGLVWDGQERINRLFIHYFPGELPADAGEARDQIVAYLEKVGECFLISAVARIDQPGCKVDTLPVLISPEAFNKSQGLQALCPVASWFTDDVSPDLTDRDTKSSLQGKLICELAEFPHAKREVERFKAFASRQVDRYRRPYDRLPQDWPRQCVLVGTANELELISVTGNRRIWPFWLAGLVRIADIERDRDQLWAEAVHWYRKGTRWWLEQEIEAIARKQQAAFLEEDIWDVDVAWWIEHKAPRDLQNGNAVLPFTTREVLTGLRFSLEPAAERPITRADEMRVARCLKRLGYRRDTHQQTYQGHKERRWTPLAELTH